jgi:VanZ family protein
VVLVGALELLQLLVPGRHARLEDFVVDALAALAGFAIAAIIGWLTRSHWHANRVE